MSASTNDSGACCIQCGAKAGRECIHKLMNGINTDGNFTKIDAPVTTAPTLSAITRVAPWQPSPSNQSRSLRHLLSPAPQFLDRNRISIPLQPGIAQELEGFAQSPVFHSHALQKVTAEDAPAHEDHSSQVTALDFATSSLNQSPAHGEDDSQRLESGFHVGGDAKPYIESANPSHLQASYLVMKTSHPRDYHPHSLAHDHKSYTYIQNAAATPHLPTMSYSHNDDGPSNPSAGTSLGVLRYADLPRDRDLQDASDRAVRLFNEFRAANGALNDEVQRQALHEIEDPATVPKSQDLHRLQGIETYFDNVLTAEAYRAACRPNQVEYDTTIPRTLLSKRNHVRTLVMAFNSVAHANDNRTMKQPFIDRRHDQKLVEVLCWQILQAIISRATFSDPLMMSYDASKARDSVGISKFAERFDAVVQAMIGCKTICKHMYDAPYFNIVVDDPHKAKARVDSNRALNAIKAKQMADGKKAQEIKAEEEGTPAPPSKRKRTARVSTPTAAIQSPFHRRDVMASTPPRMTTMPLHFMSHSPMDQDPTSSPLFPSSPDDINVSPARFALGPSKIEYPQQIPVGGQRFGMGHLGMSRDGRGNSAFPFGRHPSGMEMGPPPPGAPVPMQPDGAWNNPVSHRRDVRSAPPDNQQQYSAMSAYNLNFGSHGSRQQSSFGSDDTSFANGESSNFDTPGSDLPSSGSGVDNDSPI
jgi:hypothetical protein